VHAHAALFGVYGFLALGFTLLVLRYVRPNYTLNPRLMSTAFWGLNGGLVLMIATSLLPMGIIQFIASASEGLWYAQRGLHAAATPANATLDAYLR
jgi:nitric oxide reductase subunit B